MEKKLPLYLFKIAIEQLLANALKYALQIVAHYANVFGLLLPTLYTTTTTKTS